MSTMFQAVTHARQSIAGGQSWQTVISETAKYYGVDPAALGFLVGQAVAGTRPAACFIPRERGRPSKAEATANVE